MKNQRMYAILAVLAAWVCLSAHQILAMTPREIYQKVSPAVVFILALEGSQMGRGGTGSIIREDGLVITNAHILIRDPPSKLPSDVSVFLKPEKVTGSHGIDLSRRYRGEVLAYDLPLDLALVRIRDVNVPLTPVPFGDSNEVVTGDQAFAIGHPEQGGLWSLTTGVISAQRQDFNGVRGKNLFQTEASINRGNSGGPLLNDQGNMIGINSMIARKARDGTVITDVNFSIKSNVALKWLDRLGYRFAAIRHVQPTTEKEGTSLSVSPNDTPSQESEEPKPSKLQYSESRSPALESRALESVEERKRVSEKSGKPEGRDKSGVGPGEERENLFQEGEILTEKNPYNMDELIASMEEMEDLMEEMREKINKLRKRRKYP